MRILFLNHNVVRRGGTFHRAYQVARYLVRLGHSVTLLSISAHRVIGFSRERCDGVDIIHTPDWLWGVGRTGWDPFDTMSRCAYLTGQSWDVIHAWDCRPAVILPALWARHWSRRAGGKLLIDWADWWGRGGTQAERGDSVAKALYGPIETFFEEAFRARADGTTVASRALRERVVALGVSEDSVQALPGGCDTDSVRPIDRGEARAQLGIPSSEWVVGYLGALPIREADLLARTLVITRASIPRLRFLAIGVSIAGSNVPLSAMLRDIWGEWITHTGRIPFETVGLYLSACDAVILPMRRNISNAARWPSKINDYLSAGRAIVATPVGEVEQLLRLGVGVTADDNPQALAAALDFLHTHPDEGQRLGRQGRLLAEGELNWRRVTQRLAAFYDEIHGRND